MLYGNRIWQYCDPLHLSQPQRPLLACKAKVPQCYHWFRYPCLLEIWGIDSDWWRRLIFNIWCEGLATCVFIWERHYYCSPSSLNWYDNVLKKHFVDIRISKLLDFLFFFLLCSKVGWLDILIFKRSAMLHDIRMQSAWLIWAETCWNWPDIACYNLCISQIVEACSNKQVQAFKFYQLSRPRDPVSECRFRTKDVVHWIYRVRIEYQLDSHGFVYARWAVFCACYSHKDFGSKKWYGLSPQIVLNRLYVLKWQLRLIFGHV